MTNEGENELIKAVSEWVKRHPEPKKKVLVVGDNTYSPEEILEEMKQGTEFGKQQLQSIYQLAVELFMRRQEK